MTVIRTFPRMAALAALALTTALGLTACSSDADVASKNLSKQADDFQILRRVIFYNGISGDYVLEIKGFCSLGNDDAQGKVSVTCKLANGTFKKHFLGLSDNVTFFAEQLESKDVGTDMYEVNFKPSTIIPDVEVR